MKMGCGLSRKKKYDLGKLECRGLLRALKKLRLYLYGVRFSVEIDAKTLVHQLNQPTSDLPGSVANRWLAWIRLFDFELKHVAGVKHGGPDALSRKEYDSDNECEEDIEAIMDAENAKRYEDPPARKRTRLGKADCRVKGTYTETFLSSKPVPTSAPTAKATYSRLLL